MPSTRGDEADARDVLEPDVPEPTFTVAAVARRLGVAPSTLRTWDRRYGLGPTEHEAGAHRRYSAADVGRLVVMRRLTMDGVPPAEAARIAVRADPEQVVDLQQSPVDLLTGAVRLEQPSSQVPPPSGALTGRVVSRVGPMPVLGRELAPDAPRDAEVQGESGAGPGLVPRPWGTERQAVQGGGRVVAMPDCSPAARGLARATMTLDTPEVTRLIRETMRTQGIVHTWDLLVLPVLRALGERWRATGEGIEVEHAFTEVLLSVFRGRMSSLHRPRNGRPVLLCVPEGDRHSLPLYALAAALAEESIGSRMFGSGMPAASLLAAVRRCGPSVVFLYARLPVDDVRALEEIPRQRPMPRVVVGGRGWDPDVLPRCARLVGSLGEAVDEVAAAVGP
ncbi:MAG: MerR family transcriptional regulator [Actinomycetales bacterium]|nr:MerR family transcriptional regulator [Actinomycetales bacterium]